MFESLSDKLKRSLKNLRGQGKLTPEHVDAALREIRMALLEADVNYKVAKDFVENVRAKAEGQAVWQDLKPHEQVVKIVYDELAELMGCRVQVESQVGSGSHFWVDLSLSEAPAEAAPPPEHRVDNADDVSVSVLLAEDDLVNQMVVEQMLKSPDATTAPLSIA